MKAKSAKPSFINEPARCQRRTLNGQCRMPAVDSSGTLCFDHTRALDDHTDHSAVLTRFSRGFQTVEGINFALGDLYVLLAQGRISPRRAAVLTYMASLMLRTLPLMHKNPGKYVYRLIGATRPPSQADYFIEGQDQHHAPEPTELDEVHEKEAQENVETKEAEVAEADEAQEKVQARETVEAHENDAQENAEPENGETHLKPVETLSPGQSSLPATREAYLNAVDQALNKPAHSTATAHTTAHTTDQTHQPATKSTDPKPDS